MARSNIFKGPSPRHKSAFFWRLRWWPASGWRRRNTSIWWPYLFPPTRVRHGRRLRAALVLRVLPLRVRRPVVFVLVLVVLAGSGGGLYYFQFVIKPAMVKGFISAAFAPKPTAVSAEPVKVEKWPPQLPAIGTLARLSGHRHRAAGRGRGHARSISSRAKTSRRARRSSRSTISVEQADLKNGLAQLKNADVDA